MEIARASWAVRIGYGPAAMASESLRLVFLVKTSRLADLLTKGGKPRYLLNHRWRVSRQLDHWLAKISEAIERQSAAGQQPPRAEFADYVRALQRIALGHDGAKFADQGSAG